VTSQVLLEASAPPSQPISLLHTCWRSQCAAIVPSVLASLCTRQPLLYKSGTFRLGALWCVVRKVDNVRQALTRLHHLTLACTGHSSWKPPVSQERAVDLPDALLFCQTLEVVLASVVDLQLSYTPPLILHRMCLGDFGSSSHLLIYSSEQAQPTRLHA